MRKILYLWITLRPCTAVWLSLISQSAYLSGDVCGSISLKELQKLQIRAARIVTNHRSRKSVHHFFFQDLGWQTINDLEQTETFKCSKLSENHETTWYLLWLFRRLSETNANQLRKGQCKIHCMTWLSRRKILAKISALPIRKLLQKSNCSVTLLLRFAPAMS